MPAFLGLIPPKVWLILAGVLALGGFAVYERHEGASKVEAKVEKADAKAVAKTAKLQDTAQTESITAGEIYEKAVGIPAVDDVGLLCEHTVSAPLPKAPVGPAPGSAPAAERGEGPAFDPTGALLTRAREADAQIVYLQMRINLLESEMMGAP